MVVLNIDCYIGLFGTGFMQVLYLGKAPRTKETLPDFREKCRVARHSRVFRGLTGSQRTPGFWGVTVLDYEKIKFVLDTPKPTIPKDGANDITKTEHATWENANTSLRCYILASVVCHLRQQITPLDSGVEMLQTLEGMFAKSTASERQAAITDLINTRMTGGRVKDHCLAMISHISRAEVMGAKLQKEMKIDLILQSLPKHFNQFKVNYNMHKMDLTPGQLMHELESAEQSLKEPGNINFTEGSIKPKGKPKGGNKNKKKKAVIPVTKSNAMKKRKASASSADRKDIGNRIAQRPSKS